MSGSRYTIDDIKNFIIAKTGCDEGEVLPECDIVNDLGCAADDFHELIEEYTNKFNVNMDGYLWYFHTEEEGHYNSIGRLFSAAPYERVTHISVTPNLLLESANAGKWLITYPEHSLPKRRYDVLVNQIVFLLFTAWVIYKCAG